jgi:hypothetical protein
METRNPHISFSNGWKYKIKLEDVHMLFGLLVDGKVVTDFFQWLYTNYLRDFLEKVPAWCSGKGKIVLRICLGTSLTILVVRGKIIIILQGIYSLTN